VTAPEWNGPGLPVAQCHRASCRSLHVWVEVYRAHPHPATVVSWWCPGRKTVVTVPLVGHAL
jgi:hypothetical protein